MAPRTKAAAAAAEEPDDEFEEMETEEDEDLEELEEMEDDEPEEAPKPKGKRAASSKAAPKTSTIERGSPWLAAYVTEQTGEKLDSRSARMLLRKLARDGKIDREVGVERARYSFTGPNDPTVKAILEMVKSGEAKAMKQQGLDKVKEQAAAKRAAAKAAKAKEEAEDEDEMEEVEEAPKPRTRRAAPAKSAPAKATPAKATTTRRRASTTA